MALHWISCLKFTVAVETDDRERITRTAPIVGKFRGQPLTNLIRWASGFGGLKHVELSEGRIP